MAGRNYHSYRGRTPKWKVIVSVLLVLIIVASLGFLSLQRYIVYDETGTPHFLLPGSSEVQEQPSQQPHANLVVEQTPAVEEKEPTVVYLGAEPIVTVEDAQGLLAAARGCTGPAVTLKADTGRVYFRTPTAISSGAEDETAGAIAALVSGTDRAAARLVCFADPKAANSDVEGLGLKNTGGFIFYDGANRQWLDPAKEAARSYLVQLAVECAQMGFDEIILSGVSYPTEGKLHKIAYGERSQDENLGLFLKELTDALKPYEVTLTLEMSAEGILLGKDDGGLTLETAVKYAHRICAVTQGEEAENLTTIVGRCSETVEFVPILTQLPFGYEESAILAGTNE